MKLYADLPGRRTLQILADLGIVAWVCTWAWVGRVVHDATLQLGAPGRQLQSAGSGFREQMTGAGDAVSDVPLVGDKIASPFRRAGTAGTTIQQAGTDLVTAVERLANLLGWVTALVPIVIVGLVWLFVRGRFVRRATAAQRFIDQAADLDLFALRAMAGQPMRKLAAISPDPTGAWRRGEESTIRALALLELRDSGLQPPAA
ncbi:MULTISPECIES: hypothetical protein [unclassified Phycicoccus]|uniref:hypothetical protein n=1 Tax=unclassified Phycicoccus TaxID=2637926 RepID=UPI000703797E|nr:MULTISPECIES: hypothetical protein [unclassified Phycicoccus]KQU68741.1 hypothetical protein ASC58_08570 [Phycicoccus sp. Root101]KQZ88234.1 hypothetical protein ASD62_01725 [Phycicoccus sp. Root563]